MRASLAPKKQQCAVDEHPRVYPSRGLRYFRVPTLHASVQYGHVSYADCSTNWPLRCWYPLQEMAPCWAVTRESKRQQSQQLHRVTLAATEILMASVRVYVCVHVSVCV